MENVGKSSMMGKTTIKVICNKETYMIPLEGNDLAVLLHTVRDRYRIPSDIALRPLDSPVPVSSMLQLRELREKGKHKFEVVILPSLPPRPPEEKKIDEKKPEEKHSLLEQKKEEEEKKVQPISRGKDAAMQSRPYKLNPAVLKEMFRKFITSDPSVIEIIDLVRREKKGMLQGQYKLEDYAQTLRMMEDDVADALQNNVFLVDIDAPADCEEPGKKGEKELAAFKGMPMDQSVCEDVPLGSNGAGRPGGKLI